MLLIALAHSPAGAQNAQAEIKQRVEVLRGGLPVSIAGHVVRPSELLAQAYEERAFVPLWSDAGRRAALRRAVERLEYDGLRPEHYYRAALELGVTLPSTDADRAGIDLLYTAALLRAAQDLRFGHVDPITLRSARESDLERTERQLLLDIVGLPPDSALDLMRPRHGVYRGMVAAMTQLSAQKQRGGWTPVPAVLMKVGTAHGAVAALRRRLAQEGDLRAAAGPRDSIFDDSLAAAVRVWQHRHGLNEDGVVGPATQRELDVPLEDRIDQLRVNLERARWIGPDLAETFVVVNVAGALVYYVRNGTVRFETRAIVGRTATRTPIFTAQLRYIDLNPTWTVPPGIVQEVLSAIRRNPGYLRAQNMRVIDRAGRVLNPAAIDFSRYTGRTFPYVFRQEPGPLNPLGLVKLVFPNPHNVYLHDTPARELFLEEQRTFSHGCIRVEHPLKLAELVLDDPAWTAESLRGAVDEGATRTITLPASIPVLVLYWTAATDLHGELHFYRDVYGRDAAILAALSAE